MEAMPSHLLSEWQAFAILEPFGSFQEILGHAFVAMTVHNQNRKRPWPLKKFLALIVPPKAWQEYEEKDKPRSFFDYLKSFAKRKKT